MASMETILLYSEGIEPQPVSYAFPGADVVVCDTQRELIDELVARPGLLGAVIDIARPDASWQRFLRSVGKSFPMLSVFLLVGDTEFALCAEMPCMQRTTSEAEITARLAVHFVEPKKRNRRRYHRFCWPLTASLQVPGTPCAPETDDGACGFPVVEISAGGALLQSGSVTLNSGQRGTITIGFQNIQMRAECEILDPRHSSSNSVGTFAVRFVGLSEEAQSFIDRVVSDALIAVLLDPSLAPDVPSIEEDDEILLVSDEFSLVP